MPSRFPGVGALLALLTLSLSAQEKPMAFIGAQIIPIAGAPLDNGILLVQHGRILAIGDADSVRLAADVQIVDVSGKVIMPGLIAAPRPIGRGPGGHRHGPAQPKL